MSLASLMPVHDIHVSNTEIKKTAAGDLEIIVRIFYDDLQLAMGLQPGQALPNKYRNADELIEKYLQTSLKWTFDGKVVKPRYIKSKAALPAVWVYLEVSNPLAGAKEIRLDNRILLDQFDDQVNMVHASIDGMDYHFVLNQKDKYVIFRK